MSRYVKDLVELLMYKGPTIGEIIENAMISNNMFSIENKENCVLLTIKSEMPYFVQIEDKYLYNKAGDLLKQITIINGNEKVVFDKFQEALVIVESCKFNNCLPA